MPCVNIQFKYSTTNRTFCFPFWNQLFILIFNQHSFYCICMLLEKNRMFWIRKEMWAIRLVSSIVLLSFHFHRDKSLLLNSTSKQKLSEYTFRRQIFNCQARHTCSQKRFLILGIGPGPRPWFLLPPICTYAGIMFGQIDHGRFFEKMSFSQPRGPPEKVGGHIFM